jgi:hypothetical protein
VSAALIAVVLLLFGGAAVSITRLEMNHHVRDRELAWNFGTACVLAVLTTSLLEESDFSLPRAATAAVALGSLPLAARMLYPEGIDLRDAVVSAFVGFVIGSVSWTLAWQATLAAAAAAGLYAAFHLVRNGEAHKRVPFVSILVGFALVGTAATALLG